MFILKRDEAKRGWRRLQCHDFHSSSNIIRVIKERRIIWVGHVAHIVFNVSAGNPE
jgi:hypothetical protein